MNFGNQEGGTEEFLVPWGEGQKNFTDPIEKNLESQNINLYLKNVT